MSITIKDLARETGLGGSTVSAYLNGVPVRSYNKDKIEKAIKKLGYIRNDYARGLKTHKSKTIGVLIPELSNVFSTTIIAETEELLRLKGYGIVVCDCKSDPKLEQNALKFLLSKMVDGLVVMPVTTNGKALDIALKNGVPAVVIDRLTDNDKVSHIVINNKEISKKATERLLQKGAQKIVMIAGSADVYTAKERLSGYREAMENAGFYDEKFVFDGEYTVEGGYRATKHAMKTVPDADAVFVSNYEMSIGCLIALKEEGKKIGEDIGFMGFDNVELSKVFSPKLETVTQPLKEIGRVAAETILSMLGGKPVRNIVLEAIIED